jgi:hypothetical protein
LCSPFKFYFLAVHAPSFRHYLIAVEGVVEIDPGGLRGDGNGWGFS